MNTLRNLRLRSMLQDTRGLSTVEYVIILVLIAGIAIGTWQKFGSKVHEKLGKANTEFDTVKIGEQ